MPVFENLPIFIFILAFFVVFVLFLRGGFSLLITGVDEEKIAKGRRRMLVSLYSLFILLLVVFVFFLVTYLLQRGKVLLPLAAPGEFPPSPVANVPPPPEFIEVDGLYFSGPWRLKENNYIDKAAVYAILCEIEKYDKYDKIDYDIIYIGETGGKSSLSENKQYRCWVEECDSKLENLYLAVLWMPSDKYSSTIRRTVKEKLENQILPPCPLPEI